MIVLAILSFTILFTSCEEETNNTPLYYDIGTAEELGDFRDLVNEGTTEDFDGKIVRLTADITLTGEWIPIGNGTREAGEIKGNAFEGVFDGNNKTISGLTITSATTAESVGLFGAITGKDTIIKDLTVSGSIDNPASKQAGLVVALIGEGATVDNCTTTDTSSVKASRGSGGIAGRIISNGAVKNSTNNASVSSTFVKPTPEDPFHNSGVGGVVGTVYYAKVEDASFFGVYHCVNNGAVMSTSEDVSGAGGIVGFIMAGEIKNSKNNGALLGNDTSIGGIVGEAGFGAIIDNCENTADIENTAKMGTGGLVGWIRYFDFENAYPSESIKYDNASVVKVSNSVNSGNVKGTAQVGGAIGAIYFAAEFDTVETSGDIEATGTQIGGFCGGIQTPFAPTTGSTRDNVVSFKNCKAEKDGAAVIVTTPDSVKGTFIGHTAAVHSKITFDNCSPGIVDGSGYEFAIIQGTSYPVTNEN